MWDGGWRDGGLWYVVCGDWVKLLEGMGQGSIATQGRLTLECFLRCDTWQ